MLSFSTEYSLEGEVWVCGGRHEEIQSVHDQQSSGIEQGGTKILEKSPLDLSSLSF